MGMDKLGHQQKQGYTPDLLECKEVSMHQAGVRWFNFITE